MDPELGFALHAGTLAAARERAAKWGIAAEKIDDLVVKLRGAKDGGYEWVGSTSTRGLHHDRARRRQMVDEASGGRDFSAVTSVRRFDPIATPSGYGSLRIGSLLVRRLVGDLPPGTSAPMRTSSVAPQ